MIVDFSFVSFLLDMSLFVLYILNLFWRIGLGQFSFFRLIGPFVFTKPSFCLRLCLASLLPHPPPPGWCFLRTHGGARLGFGPPGPVDFKRFPHPVPTGVSPLRLSEDFFPSVGGLSLSTCHVTTPVTQSAVCSVLSLCRAASAYLPPVLPSLD